MLNHASYSKTHDIFNKYWVFVGKIIFSISLVVGTTSLFSQQDLSSIKENATKKIETIKDSLASNHFNISGTCKATMAYTISMEDKPLLDYQFNINVQGSYKGLKLPFQYTFSNGKSIYRFNGPSFRIPSFKSFGFSPSYKGYTLHIGNRTMDFSKYTYQNVRFQGIGIQTPEKGMYLKIFTGKLRLLDPNDYVYRSSIEPVYVRKAWGSLVGYSTEKTQIKAMAFKANDQADSLMLVDMVPIFPKENTVVSYSAVFEPIDHILIEVTQAFSAFTHNSLSPRINILTPQSTKNMFGLFEKKESSEYYSSAMMEVKYSLKEQNISFIHESVDKNYRSLGSLYFDNNFIENKLKFSGLFREKLNYSLSGGIREIKTKQEITSRDSKVVFQSMVSYPWNEHISSYASFNNFKTVQQDYYRGLNSSTVDSISLSQVNSAISVGSNYMSKGEYPFTIGLISSFQTANSIQNEVVQENNTKNRLVSMTYSRQLEKSNLNATISYINTISSTYQNKTIGMSFMYGKTIWEKITLSTSTQYQSISFSDKHVNQLITRGTFEYMLDPDKSLILDLGLDFSDAKEALQLNRFIGQLDVHIKF